MPPYLSVHTPIESVEIVLGFRGEFDDVTAVPVTNQVSQIVKNLKGIINNNGITSEITGDALYIKLSLIGTNKVDVAYRLEQMVYISSLNITFSQFVYHL